MGRIRSHRAGGELNCQPILIISTVLALLAVFWAGVTNLDAATFELSPRKVYAYPGEEDKIVPLLLTNSDSVAGWEILMEYDNSGGVVSGVSLYDSLQAVDPAGDTLVWFYAPWHGHPESRPEYFSYNLNAGGHENWVRVIGIMDLQGPEDPIPPVAPGEEQLMFGFVFDVNPFWDGQSIVFDFQTTDCSDNTLSDPTGWILWGPDTLSAPPSTCPDRPESLRVIRLTRGSGIEARQASCGDVNDNGIPWEVSDGVALIQYLQSGTQYPVMAAGDVDSCVGVTWSDYGTMAMVVGGCWPPPSTCPPTTSPQPSLLDTLIIGNILVSPGENVLVDVGVVNSESLGFLTIPLLYDTSSFTAESVWVNDIFPEWEIAELEIDDTAGTVIISLLNEGQCPPGHVAKLAPGRHCVASILFAVDPMAEDTMINIDTCSTDRFWLQWDCSIPVVVSGMVDEFIRADADADMDLDMADALYILKYLYIPWLTPPCMDALDADDGGHVSMGDAIQILRYMYVPGTPPIPAPFPDCGVDPTLDRLDCGSHPCMEQ